MNHLCIYAKPPIPGKTKSRLAKSIGEDAAAKLAKATLIDICNELLGIPDTKVSLWHPPNATPSQYQEFLPAEIGYHAQSGEDLGERMKATFHTLLNGSNKVVIVGSDCLTHCKESIAATYRGLDHAEIALQPARDGGYVLVAQRSYCPEIFDTIDWGTSSVLEQTYEQMKKFDYSYALLPETFDIDVEADLQELRTFVSQQARNKTREWFQEHDL